MSGVNAAVSTSTVGTSTTATLSGFPSGSIIAFAVSQSGSTSNPTISNAGTVTYLNPYSSGSNLDVSGFAIASGTSTTLTLGASATSNSVIALTAFYYIAPTVTVSQTCVQSGTTCVFGSAPSNGSEVVGAVVGDGTCTPTVTDSNSVALTSRYCFGIDASSGLSGQDYKVSGSPTSTYACLSGPTCALLNVTGTTLPGTYSSTTGPDSGVVSTSVATTPGDLVVCAASGGVSAFSGMSFVSGVNFNVQNLYYSYGGGGSSRAVIYATATGSSATCQTSSSNAGFTLGIGLADYTPGSSSSTSKACSAFPWPCAFQSGYAPRRKATLADLLR
jgi:hypothetical protein